MKKQWVNVFTKQYKILPVETKGPVLNRVPSTVLSDYHSSTTWAPRSKTLVVTPTGARHKVNLISAISLRGSMRFMATEVNVTSSVFFTLLKHLMAGAGQPIFMIVDNHSIHSSGEVLDFEKNTRDRLRFFYLLPYAPELNPDDQALNYPKNHKIGRQRTKNGWEPYKRVDSVMRSLQKLPAKIRSFFRHPMTKCTLMFGNQCTN